MEIHSEDKLLVPAKRVRELQISDGDTCVDMETSGVVAAVTDVLGAANAEKIGVMKLVTNRTQDARADQGRFEVRTTNANDTMPFCIVYRKSGAFVRVLAIVRRDMGSTLTSSLLALCNCRIVCRS